MNKIKNIESKEIKEKIIHLKTIISGMIYRLNHLNKNLDVYFEIYDTIMSNFDIKKRNYCILQNINNMEKFNINFIGNITEIIKDDNLKSQFTNIVSLQAKIDFKRLKENKSQIVQIEHKEEIKEIISEKNNDKNIIENYTHSVDKYENFSVSKIKELKNFTTKNEINKLLVLNDGRVLTTQMYYDEKGDTFYKLCVYSLNNGFVCDINIDFYDVREIYLMDDGNILINNHDENPIKVIKILDNKIEEVWKFDKLDSIEKKLSKDKILISTKKKRDKPYFNEFFQVYVDFKWENEIFTYDKGQLVFYKNIHKFYRDIKAKNMIQINENEYVFYAKQKGKIYGENDFLIFYDIQTGNVLKKLKVGKGENGTEMLLLNKDILLIQGNETVILIDIKNRKISKEYKFDFCFDPKEVVFLNEKTFLHHCVIKKQPDKLLQYEIKDLKTLELKEEKVIDLKTYFIYSKYPGNKLIISDCKNLLSIYG